MPDAVVFVGRIRRASSDAFLNSGDLAFELEEGRTARLSRGHSGADLLAEVLSRRAETGEPVYVATAPESDEIVEVAVPFEATVREITSGSGEVLEVELGGSQAVHRLSTDNSRFAGLRRALEAARKSGEQVLVTDRDGEILDVRPAPLPFAAGAKRSADNIPTHADAPPITFQRARELFAIAAAPQCAPQSPDAPCIPFNYPDNGCWARAHEMCRLTGVTEKAWINAVRPTKLRLLTANDPECYQEWFWHVAPLVRVPADGSTTRYVFDPSISPDGPMTLEAWRDAQSTSKHSTITERDWVWYNSWSNGDWFEDPDFTRTRRDLQTYRDDLKLRVAKHGAPPYARCR